MRTPRQHTEVYSAAPERTYHAKDGDKVVTDLGHVVTFATPKMRDDWLERIKEARRAPRERIS